MSVKRATAIIAASFVVTIAGLAVAADDGFESLLQEISQPSPTQQPAAANTASPADASPAADLSTDTQPVPEVSMQSDAAAAAAASSASADAAIENAAAADAAADNAAASADAAADNAAAANEAAADAVRAESSAAQEVLSEPAASAPAEETATGAATVESDPFAAGGMDETPAPVTEATTEAAPSAEAQPSEEFVTEPAAEEPAAAPVAEAAPAAEEPPASDFYSSEPPTEAPAAEAAAPAVEPMAAEAVVPAEEFAPTEATAPAEEAVAAEPTEEAPAAGVSEISAADAEAIASQEEIRRQAKETQALKTFDSGMKSAESADYDKAIKDLELALTDLPDRPANAQIRAQASEKLADAYTRKAQNLLASKTNLSDALTAAEKAKQYGARDADALILRIKKEQARQDEIAARPIPPAKRKQYLDKQSEIDALLLEGRQLYKIADYNASEATYEKVLLKDEYNVEAMRYLRKIDEIRYDIKTKERQATEADMIQKVRDAWNPPIREEVTSPNYTVGPTAVEKKTASQKLQEKMEKITFPLINFRQANIIDVVNFLNEESANLDPEGVGVNIILKLNAMGGDMGMSAPSAAPAPAAPADDLFGGGTSSTTAEEPFASSESAVGPSSSAPTITLSLRRVSLLNAIKYITEVANLKYRIDEDAVIITPVGAVEGRVITRLYPVQPTFLDVVVEKGTDTTANNQERGEFVAMGTANETIHKSDVKEFFERSGVPFPPGTSITFNPGISQLIVANTPENLEIFERILSQLNVIPSQVEIEARFVEIGQDDLEELGFQWILTDNYEIAQKEGSASIAGNERIQVNKDLEGVTKGLRFFEFGDSGDYIAKSAALGLNPVGNVATIASVLTNPELTVVIQALSQHGGSDLLSAPRVTTRSGNNAQIQVVKEIIYPTEFETTQPQFSNSAGDTQIVTPPLVTPGSFETRETGVILNVTPTVGPDGYTIDLTMVPEVTELVDWINYGSSVGSGAGAFTFNIPQPVFATRKVTTSIVIWDGQTVVMGGLIREDLVKVHDKIPILGDIPLIGRLFRSEGEYSKKKNLLIFVTARLVDPAGKTIHKAGEVGAADEGAATEPTTAAGT